MVFNKEDLKEEDQYLADYLSDTEAPDYSTFEGAPVLQENFPNTVVVYNTPVVPQEKVGKLGGVIQKIFAKDRCKDPTLVDVEMPVSEETKLTSGVAIVTFPNPRMAKGAVEDLDGLELDSKHKFKVFHLDDVRDIRERKSEFDPAMHQVEGFSRHDEREYLLDPLGREQFLLRYQDETEILWMDPNESSGPTICYAGQREKANGKVWCNSRVAWSGWGSFFATFHPQGIVQWSGPQFMKKNRFNAKDVSRVDFSPDEEYMLTWDGKHPKEDEEAVKIFSVRTGEFKRAFPTPIISPSGDFPHFLWSASGKYFARMTEKDLVVYGTADFSILKDHTEKRTAIKLDILETFQWSPKDDVIATWSPEKGNSPACLALFAIPSRTKLATKNLFNIRDAQLFWQSEGDYLCLQVVQLTKSGKSGSTKFEIFRMREKNIPVEMVSIKEVVKLFSWEPRSNRFAVLCCDEQGRDHKIVFYTCKPKVERVCEWPVPISGINQITWAPYGKYFVLSAMQSGELMFCCLTEQNKCELFHKDEHFMLTDVSWDPSSRYVMTAVTQPMNQQGFRYSQDSGYAIWTFQGRALYKCQKERLWQVQWRPHPPSLLPKEKIDYVHENLKQYSKRYESIDDSAKDEQRKAVNQKRTEQLKEFTSLLEELEKARDELYAQTGFAEAHQKLLAASKMEEVSTVIETDIDRTEEMISG